MSGRKTKSVWSAWFRSYVLILLIPMLVMLLVYVQTGSVIEKEMNRSNGALLRQLQQELDGQIDHIQRMSDVIALNARVRNLLYATKPLGAEQRLTMVQALADFRVYTNTNVYIDRFYVYFDNGQFVLGDRSYYEPEMYYQLNLADIGIDYEAWKRLMERRYRGQFIRIGQQTPEAGKEVDEGHGTVVYIRSLPPEGASDVTATLVVQMNEERLQSSMRNIQALEQGKLFVLGEGGEIMTSTDPQTVLDPSLAGLLRGESGVERVRLGQREMAVSYIRSKLLNWTYVYMLPTDLYEEKAAYVRNLTMLGLGATLLIGAATAYVLARRNYVPIRQLVQSLSSKMNKAYQGSDNEYAFIEATLDDALDEKHHMHRQIEQQNAVLRSGLLTRLLKGRIERNFPLEDALFSYGIRFQSDMFAVMLFYIEDFSALFREEEQDTEKNMKLVHLIIQNIVEETVQRRHQGFVVELDDMLACIVNYREAGDADAATQETTELIAEVQQFIGRKFHIQFKVSVSGIHFTTGQLPRAYQEAVEAMEYRMLLDADSVLLYSRIHHADTGFQYTMEKEQQLINYVKAGDYAAASDIVGEVIGRNLSGGALLSVDMARCLMFDMIGTMVKASAEVLAGQPELYRDNRLAIQALLQCETALQMQEKMLDFLQQVCALVEQRKRSHNVRLKDDVLHFIAERHGDPNLSVTMIADSFDIHASYLSRFFKEQTGDTVSDYINKFRIAEAKRLLLDERTVIKQIAEQVGFYSISTFIRTFKKYEGVTPSIYRESQS